MDSKHLAAGQSCPPLIPGSLRIYSMRFCPYAQRALLAAAAKAIQYDVVNINLISKPEFMFPKNPDAKVPTIETDDGRVLYESLIVCDYIDEAFNKPDASGGDTVSRKLNPSDPFQKSLDRILVEKFTKVSSLDFQLYFPSGLQSDQVVLLMNKLIGELELFEKELERRGTKFFAGSEKPGMLDYMIWPWMERLPSLELIHEANAPTLRNGRQRHPLLSAWEKAMIADDAVKESYLSPEIHAKYRSMKRSGEPINYDFL
ncbi:Pyrimidodiazepine synthase [Orchesella cincta]|uniref:Pyrimidodiazepine synthase n=1 Tax=Orchesella cincta TaxID=48709 RepID=A0A1D2NIS7_ORCCI|nr:Pyrimidodiazepine synthase [Orchesella cincta]